MGQRVPAGHRAEKGKLRGHLCGLVLRVIASNELPDGALGLWPKAAGLSLFRASQLLDEAPVAQRFPSERGFGHASGSAERFDFVDERVDHAPTYMRVVTRPSTAFTGSFPLLRGATRAGYNPGMGQPSVNLGKLRALIIAHTGPGKKFSRRALSLTATEGRNPDLVRDIMRTGKQRPTLGSAAGICAALGVDLSEVVKGVQVATEAEEWLTVCRTVNAGVWREQTDWATDDVYQVRVGAPIVDGDRFGAVVEGRSMDRILPPGTILECVNLLGSSVVPVTGDYVLAERKQGPLHELTCKRLRILPNGSYELHAESTLPEFSRPLFIGKPDKNYAGENETRIVAIVVRAHLQLFNAERRKAEAA